MTTYGITATGFVRKPLDVIVSDLESRFRDAFGIGIRLDAKSVFGKIVGAVSPAISDVWELAEHVYNAGSPSGAADASLDGCMELVGLVRKAAEKSTTTEVVIVEPGTTIPAESVIATVTTAKRFVTVDELVATQGAALGAYVTIETGGAGTYTVTLNGHAYSTVITTETIEQTIDALVTEISAGIEPVNAMRLESGNSSILLITANELTYAVAGTGSEDDMIAGTFTIAVTGNLTIDRLVNMVGVEAEETGPVDAYAHTLTEIATPVSGWSSASNPFDAAGGQDEELDPAAKIRRLRSLAKPGATTPDALRAQLLELDGVTNATVLQNVTDSTDSDGLLPHSIKCIVVGGANSDIAQAIWDYAGGGIYTNGDETEHVADSEGITQTVRFSRPTEIDLWVRVTFTQDTDQNNEFPLAGTSLIASAALAYGQSHQPGQDVLPHRFVGPINSACTGIRTMVVEVALDSGGSPGGYQTVPYTIQRDEWASFSAVHITIVDAT